MGKAVLARLLRCVVRKIAPGTMYPVTGGHLLLLKGLFHALQTQHKTQEPTPGGGGII